MMPRWEAMTPTPAEALERLRSVIRAEERVIVALSGGVDSALVAWVAHDELGPGRARSITAVSPSLAGFEYDECADLARAWGLDWSTVETDEMANAAYRINDADRCYHCKAALSEAIEPIARTADATVLLGVNVDDLGDHRPGQRAARERGARFPLVEAGLTKALVRQVSRDLGLRTADKPAAACLASRIPYGTPVSIGVLAEVERAERGLRDLGFRDLRVRHYREIARIEVPTDRFPAVLERRDEIVGAVKAAGYRYVTLDLEGLRSGNLNQALGERSAGSPAG